MRTLYLPHEWMGSNEMIVTRLKFEYTLATKKGLFEKLLANPPPTTPDAELLAKATTEVKPLHSLLSCVFNVLKVVDLSASESTWEEEKIDS